MCFIFHKWSKWTFYTQEYIGTFIFGAKKGETYEFSKNRQRRVCEECGKTQDVEV